MSHLPINRKTKSRYFAPLQPIPAVSQPFEHLIVDCVGSLPRSKSGSSYLLTVMCQSTRYPAAYPLRAISARAVVKALSQFISVFGVPKIIQSDQGSNFTSRLFEQVLKQLQVKHYKSSVYHSQSQGALERFHQHLKSLIRSYCTELQADWEEGLPWLLLAAREVDNQQTQHLNCQKKNVFICSLGSKKRNSNIFHMSPTGIKSVTKKGITFEIHFKQNK